MKSRDAWLYAASWGSAMHSGDPGVCMYGFNEHCRPQSEQHRQDVLDWCEKCRQSIVENPKNWDSNELAKLNEFIDFISNQAIEPDSFIIEISLCGSVYACAQDGSKLTEQVLDDLADCNSSGDVESACQYILDTYKPQFRIVRNVNGKYENVVASKEEKKAVCSTIYGEKRWNEPDTELYLVWQAAAEFEIQEE